MISVSISHSSSNLIKINSSGEELSFSDIYIFNIISNWVILRQHHFIATLMSVKHKTVRCYAKLITKSVRSKFKLKIQTLTINHYFRIISVDALYILSVSLFENCENRDDSRRKHLLLHVSTRYVNTPDFFFSNAQKINKMLQQKQCRLRQFWPTRCLYIHVRVSYIYGKIEHKQLIVLVPDHCLSFYCSIIH